MRQSRLLRRWVFGLLGGCVLIGAMGGRCNFLDALVVIGDPDIVTVELINTTDFDVDPFLYVDPDDDIFFNPLIVDENLVIIDPPVAPDEIVALDFDCEDIGSVVSDRALLLVGPDAFEADNSPVIRRDGDFDCGNIISFIYIDDLDTGEFFVRVEVNGIFLTDTD